MLISEEQQLSFRDDGYFILENVIPSEQVDGLREECQRYIDRYDAEDGGQGRDRPGDSITTRSAISSVG